MLPRCGHYVFKPGSFDRGLHGFDSCRPAPGRSASGEATASSMKLILIGDQVFGAETEGTAKLDGTGSVHDCIRLPLAAIDNALDVSNGKQRLQRTFIFLKSLRASLITRGCD